MNEQITPSIITSVATIAAAFIIYLLSKGYYKHSKKIEQDRLMKELFKEFNERYDRINNKLDDISNISKSDWDKLDLDKKSGKKGVIIDFFNICAEEYYWYNEKRINLTIWKSWNKGMNDIYNRSEIIQKLWDSECNNDGYQSYYINAKDDFFKKKV